MKPYTPPASAVKDMAPVKLSTEGLNKQYDLARSRAQSTEQAQVGAQSDAIQRRLAAQNGGPSGVGFKLDQQMRDASAKRLADMNEGIDAAQSADMLKVKQLEDQMNFQQSQAQADRSVTERGQNLGADLSARGQDISVRGQDLQHGEFTERLDFDKVRAAVEDTHFGQQMERDWQKFLHEQYIDGENLKIADKMLNKKDFLEKAFGPLSFNNINGGLTKNAGSANSYIPNWFGGGIDTDYKIGGIA